MQILLDEFGQICQQFQYAYNIMARRRSNTVGNKLKEQDALQDKMHQSVSMPEPALIKVTIRRTNRPSRVLEIPCTLPGLKLAQIIEKQFNVAASNQVLFIKGEKMAHCAELDRRVLSFASKDIIHVHNVQNINKEVIQLSLQILNTELVKVNQIKIVVKPHQNIRNAFENVLLYEQDDIQRYAYSQSGRFLDLSRSFVEEAVQNDSIVLVAKKKCNENLAAKLELREMELIQYYKKLMKRPSLNMEEGHETPNFKKKERYNVYKSMFVPESKEIVWQQDSNSTFSRKMLIKKLLKKRSKQQTIEIYKQNLVESNQSVINSSERDSFLQPIKQEVESKFDLGECKRLILSQCLPSKNQYEDSKVSHLKPPPKIADDLFQQIEELQFGGDDDEDNDDEGNSPSNLHMSAPLAKMTNSLKCSIGKLRGVFVPTTPGQLDDDDDDDDD